MILLHGDYEDVIDAVLLIDAPKEYPLKECILVIAALILNPWTSIYAFRFITGASVIGSVAALVMRDGLILSKALFLEVIAVVIMILKRILFQLSTG